MSEDNSDLVLPDFENDDCRLIFLKDFGPNQHLKNPISNVCHVLKKFDQHFTEEIKKTKKAFHCLQDYEIALLLVRTLRKHEELLSNFLQTLKIVTDEQENLTFTEKKKSKLLQTILATSFIEYSKQPKLKKKSSKIFPEHLTCCRKFIEYMIQNPKEFMFYKKNIPMFDYTEDALEDIYPRDFTCCLKFIETNIQV